MGRIVVIAHKVEGDDPLQEEEDWLNSAEASLNAEFLHSVYIAGETRSVWYKYFFRTKGDK